MGLLQHIVLVGTSKSVTDKLQRVLNAAARIVTPIRKFDQGLSQLLSSMSGHAAGYMVDDSFMSDKCILLTL